MNSWGLKNGTIQRDIRSAESFRLLGDPFIFILESCDAIKKFVVLRHVLSCKSASPEASKLVFERAHQKMGVA